MGYRKVTERDRNPKTSHSGYNSKPKNYRKKHHKQSNQEANPLPTPPLLSQKKPPEFPRIPRKISQTSPLRHLNRRLRTPQTTPRNHHLRTPSLNSALQHILEIVLVDLFPVVDPAVDWVREIDTDLVGCVFRVMIRAGGGLGKGRGGGGGGL